jgi:hypothetical protein
VTVPRGAGGENRDAPRSILALPVAEQPPIILQLAVYRPEATDVLSARIPRANAMTQAAKKAPSDHRDVRMEVGSPLTGAKRRMFFNRFAVQSLDGHYLMHFAYEDEGGFLCDVFTCAMPAQDVARCKDRLLAYLGKTGVVRGEGMREWRPPVEKRPIEACCFIHMARTGDAGEIMLCHFSTGGLLRESKEMQGGGVVTVCPDIVAILLSTLYVQQMFLCALYPDAEQGGSR